VEEPTADVSEEQVEKATNSRPLSEELSERDGG
jgi:hypothetical protein